MHCQENIVIFLQELILEILRRRTNTCHVCMFLVANNLHISMMPSIRAVDLHSFFADPDPGVLLNADLDPAAFLMRIRIQLYTFLTNYAMRIFLKFKKTKKIAQKQYR